MKDPQHPAPRLSPDAQAEIRQDDAVFEQCLAYVRAHAAGPEEGLFGPGSVAWLIHREPIILLGAMRAIALQMAHPAVATGVEQHSNFRHDLLGRASRTSSMMYQLVFGDLEAALQVGRRLHQMHTWVRGQVEADASVPSSGQRYRANDPMLLLWVLATLVDTTALLFERLIRPLTDEEKRRYHEEAHLTAALMGIPPEAFPPSREAFYRYFHEMVDGTTLAVGRIGWQQVHALFAPPYVPARLSQILTAGLLPPRFREAFGLPWGAQEQHRFRQVIQALRRIVHLVPAPLRFAPAYHQAVLRVAHARQEPASAVAHTIDRVNRLVRLPLSLEPARPAA